MKILPHTREVLHKSFLIASFQEVFEALKALKDARVLNMFQTCNSFKSKIPTSTDSQKGPIILFLRCMKRKRKLMAFTLLSSRKKLRIETKIHQQ